MPIYQQAQSFEYIDSATTTSFTASPNTYYVVDTAASSVTIILPPNVPVGQVITAQNAPAGGFQLGGTVAGNDLIFATTAPETFDDGSTSRPLGPPTSKITAACRTSYPTGPGSQAGFNGWVN